MSDTIMVAGIDQYSNKEQKDKLFFEVAITNMPEAYVDKAKEIDGKEYTPDCFGFTYSFNIGTKAFRVEQMNGKETFYIDAEGEKHYFDFIIPAGAIRKARKITNAILQKKGLVKKPVRRKEN